jgi:hypothetical protein
MIPFVVTKYKPFTEDNDALKYLKTNFGRLLGSTGNIVARLPYLMVDTTAASNYFDIITIDSVTNILEARFDVSFIDFKGLKSEKMRLSEGYLKIEF